MSTRTLELEKTNTPTPDTPTPYTPVDNTDDKSLYYDNTKNIIDNKSILYKNDKPKDGSKSKRKLKKSKSKSKLKKRSKSKRKLKKSKY